MILVDTSFLVALRNRRDLRYKEARKLLELHADSGLGPPSLPHILEAFLATLSPRHAQQVRASTDSVSWDDVPVCRG